MLFDTIQNDGTEKVSKTLFAESAGIRAFAFQVNYEGLNAPVSLELQYSNDNVNFETMPDMVLPTQVSPGISQAHFNVNAVNHRFYRLLVLPQLFSNAGTLTIEI